MNIFQKMAAITAEMETVAKNLNVSAGKSSYKAVGERDVLDAVKPLEKKYGIYSYPFTREILESEQLESESSYDGNSVKKTTFYTHIKTVYRFVNVDKPDEFIDTVVFSVGIDSQDKGDGKAMTYGDKYALMKAYKISTGDDPDQTGSEDTKYTEKKVVKSVPAKSGEFTPTCADCGKEITRSVHDWAVKEFKQPLCMECQDKRRKAQKK